MEARNTLVEHNLRLVAHIVKKYYAQTDDVEDLISRAGFALSPSNRADLIVEYFVTQKKYDIMEIDSALFDYGQPTLFSEE